MPTLIELKKLLLKHEGVRQFPYICSAGFSTIGIGRNLDTVGISKEEAEYLLENDIKRVAESLENLREYKSLSQVRKMALIDMTFNLGFVGVLKFVKMWEAIKVRDYDTAAAEMLDSKWATQVGNRARDLAEMMRLDELPKIN